jgi:molybdenum ABC transporter ATP-binding protein
LIRIKDLTVDLGEFILKGVNIEIKRGEYFVMIGPTGAGKTILLETIAGLYQPKKGRIEINGRDVTKEEPRKRNISIVYQDYMLFPHLTVKENIEFGLKKERSSDLDKIVEFLDIQRILNRKPDTLSGGESQRVALARALVTKPAVLLLDEPLAALDINTREKIMRKLQQINEKMGITIIHITHERSEAIALADRMAVMNDGEILQVGTPEEVFRRPNSEFIANFVGVENLFKGESVIDPDTGVANIEVNKINIASTSCKSGNVFISIRPEDILVSMERIKTSARNSYNGEIMEIIDRGAITKIVVDVGIPFVAVITKRSFEDMALKRGISVYITFKAAAVHVF